MPWTHTDPTQEQVKLIEAWSRGGATVAWLAREFGVSRKAVYKRIERFEELGWGGLGDRSRAPHAHPNRTPDDIEELVLAAKKRHMTWGPKKVVAVLAEEHPGLLVPAASTAGEILKRAGLVRPRGRRRRTQPWAGPLDGAQAPNDKWTMDHKGWFRTWDGTRCDPLTVEDSYSRYCIVADGMARPVHDDVKKSVLRAFREHGLPLVIKTDNGAPFASTGLGGLTRLSAWWAKLGIVPERIDPGHPEQNGMHERMHRTLRQEAADPPALTLRKQQKALDSFRSEYNFVRPHEALGQKAPASAYRPSPRHYPVRVPEPAYRGHVQVRRVRANGEIKWDGHLVYLSGALCGEPVGLEQRDEHLWAVLFGPLEIGTLDQRAPKVLRTPVKVLPMSPVCLLPMCPVEQ